MSKYSFLDDYSEGCHPAILDAMTKTNLVQQTAYGDDDYSTQAKARIRKHLGDDNLPVFLVAGGTQANIIVISSALKSHEAIIAPESGHIVLRETGAIEATGHKIISVPSSNGKITPAAIRKALDSNAHYPHMAKPRLVYLSNATEAGTVYTKAELTAISTLCRANNLLLFVDGARLGAALTAGINDLTLKDITTLCDVFWIGGTKVGALIGEAIVLPNQTLAEDFSFHIKQRGGLLAKGRLLGVQFNELFKDNLFFDLATHANDMAQTISTAIVDNGYSLAADTESNQVFPILPDDVIDQLQEKFAFYVWGKLDGQRSVLRLVTSWATDEEQVNRFVLALKELSAG